MPFSIVNADIQKLEADVIVNPLYHSKPLHQIADIPLENSFPKNIIDHITISNEYQSVIYTTNLDWRTNYADVLLFQSYINSFYIALRNGNHSIAIPLISSDMINIFNKEILKVTLDAIREFLQSYEIDIFLVTDNNSISLPDNLSEEIEQYIQQSILLEAASLPWYKSSYDTESEHCILPEEYEERKEKHKFRIGSIFQSAKEKQCDAPAMAAPKTIDETVLCIDKIFASKEETFSRYLLRLIDESGMTDSEVYKKANIDRKHFSKIRSDENYKPKKQTVIAFAIALKLDIKGTEKLLEKAGYALSLTMEYDLIARFFIEKQIYDMYTFECVLYQYNLI